MCIAVGGVEGLAVTGGSCREVLLLLVQATPCSSP